MCAEVLISLGFNHRLKWFPKLEQKGRQFTTEEQEEDNLVSS